MPIRTYTKQNIVCATSRFVLPREVNSTMDWWNKIASNCNARVTFIPSPERPFGPLGNWMQTITITVEGDYDDPKCKSLLDALQNNNQGIISKLYEGNFSHIPKDNSTKITASPAKVEEKTNTASPAKVEEKTNTASPAKVEEKINTVPQRRTIAVSNSNTDALLKRAFFFLEDGEWVSADEYCETVLDLNPECAEAYLGKLMAELQVRKQDDLRNCEKPFDTQKDYQKIMRFGDSQLKGFLIDCTDYIKDRNEKARISGIYIKACSKMSMASTAEAYREAGQLFRSIIDYQDSKQRASLCETKAEEARIVAEQRALERKNADTYRRAKQIMESANSELNYRSAAKMFEQIRGYKDADALRHECHERATEIRNNDIYGFAMGLLQDSTISNYSDLSRCMKVIHNYKEALKRFETIVDWADSRDQIAFCQNKIAEIEAEHERKVKEDAARAKRNKIIAKITIALVCIAGIFLTVLNFVIIPNNKYNEAVSLMNAGQYEEAISAFEAMDGYKDSVDKIDKCEAAILDGKYNDAVAMMNAEKYDEASAAFEKLDGHKDSAELILECRYLKATTLMDSGMYEEAYALFSDLRKYEYRDSNDLAFFSTPVGETLVLGTYNSEAIEWIVLERKGTCVLLLASKGLDAIPYHANAADSVSWETCSLRQWLNTDFLSSFDKNTNTAILPTKITSYKYYLKQNSQGGWNTYNTDTITTVDYAFCLDYSDVELYLSNTEYLAAKPTDYALRQGAYVVPDTGNCEWWLRYNYEGMKNSGDTNRTAEAIRREHLSERTISGSEMVVRPALWIDLSAIK